ncbi:unnamed protein product [Rotaria sordida]|uniref:Uncharacterized protein n=1 Tax=Rotaria sordida TaxID=392033 RepID=A0A815C2P7_9BILA|nr:unnamed protein product [Rotaria sordida]
MTVNNDNQQAERILQLELLIEQEKKQQLLIEKEKEEIIQQGKIKQLELQLLIEKEKTKQKEKDGRINQMTLQHGSFSSTSYEDYTTLRNYLDFYDRCVDGNIHSFDIISLFNNNNYSNDNMINYIKNYFKRFVPCSEITEAQIQNTYNTVIINLLKNFKDSTSLQYLATTNQNYLDNCDIDCTFIFKNVNIDKDNQNQCLKDFVVCLGELKLPTFSIDQTLCIGQLLQYMTTLLKIQNREKIYGFLTNFQYMTYYYVEKHQFPNSYTYYKSQHIKMFNYSCKISSINTTTTEQITNIDFNENGWKLFTKFLTMNSDFYQYTALYINPSIDLLGQRYNIKKKLGNSLSSMVYLLKKNENNYSNDDLQCLVMKICTRSLYLHLFKNEFEIIKQLKQLNNSNKFNLFFEDILNSSLEGNICLLSF